jgi:hypothetical protein
LSKRTMFVSWHEKERGRWQTEEVQDFL